MAGALSACAVGAKASAAPAPAVCGGTLAAKLCSIANRKASSSRSPAPFKVATASVLPRDASGGGGGDGGGATALANLRDRRVARAARVVTGAAAADEATG